MKADPFLIIKNMKLFKYEAYKVSISEEALLLQPFKKIWNRDKSKSKERALNELAFIYFMCDPRSDYQYIVDTEERFNAIVESEGLPEDWSPDKLVEDAMRFYESFKSTSALLLEDTRIAIEKVRIFLKTMNLNDVDDKGKPLYTINSITATIKMIPQLIKDLNDAEKAINSEMIEKSGKVRGQKPKSLFEDSLDV